MGASRGQLILDIGLEVIVDNFCGGGGASEGIYMALGRHVDIAGSSDEPIASDEPLCRIPRVCPIS